MKVKYLHTDEETDWRLRIKTAKRKPSKLLQKALQVISETIPGILILEEVTIPVDKGKKLYLDIYLPKHKVCVECHGKQHGQTRVKFFQTRQQHNKQLQNDNDKYNWCIENGIKILYFHHDESPETWQNKLNRALGR